MAMKGRADWEMPVLQKEVVSLHGSLTEWTHAMSGFVLRVDVSQGWQLTKASSTWFSIFYFCLLSLCCEMAKSAS